MRIADMPFNTIDGSQVERTGHAGQAGHATWRTRQSGALRVRMVEYSPGHVADHGCTKGHVLLCLEGELHTGLADGRRFVLKPGMSYQVADDAEPHRSSTAISAKLSIVDGIAGGACRTKGQPASLRTRTASPATSRG